MGHRGENTPPVRRRLNLRKSKEKLEGLLVANFADGVQLFTLEYNPERKAPSRKMADLQLVNWLREARRTQGKQAPYIRATEWSEVDGSPPIHRVVVDLPEAVAALWSYGPVAVEAVPKNMLRPLAGRLMAQALAAGRVSVPCGRVWSPSEGLIHPEMKGTQ